MPLIIPTIVSDKFDDYQENHVPRIAILLLTSQKIIVITKTRADNFKWMAANYACIHPLAVTLIMEIQIFTWKYLLCARVAATGNITCKVCNFSVLYLHFTLLPHCKMEKYQFQTLMHAVWHGQLPCWQAKCFHTDQAVTAPTHTPMSPLSPFQHCGGSANSGIEHRKHQFSRFTFCMSQKETLPTLMFSGWWSHCSCGSHMMMSATAPHP